MKKLLVVFLLIFTQTIFAKTYYGLSSDSDAGVVNELVSSLSDQLTQNKNFRDHKNAKIAITSFVSLDDLKSTSRLSNILSENLIHEMQVRGYKVIDFKTMDKIKIDARGDFLFSRDLSKLRKELKLDFALTGTYTKYRSGVVINARIIDLKSHVVLSTAQILIPRNVAKRISKPYQTSTFSQNNISLSK
jgi:TolB-like protein